MSKLQTAKKNFQGHAEAAKSIRFIDSREAERVISVSRWTIWRHEQNGTFPKSIKIGGKRLWLESEVLAWMTEKIGERG